MDAIERMIRDCIALKQGNKEFALFYFGPPDSDDAWRAEIGNPSVHVNLGDADGELRARGRSPIEALTRLRELLAPQ